MLWSGLACHKGKPYCRGGNALRVRQLCWTKYSFLCAAVVQLGYSRSHKLYLSNIVISPVYLQSYGFCNLYSGCYFFNPSPQGFVSRLSGQMQNLAHWFFVLCPSQVCSWLLIFPLELSHGSLHFAVAARVPLDDSQYTIMHNICFTESNTLPLQGIAFGNPETSTHCSTSSFLFSFLLLLFSILDLSELSFPA